MRIFRIRINNRLYETTSCGEAWLFAITHKADQMSSAPHYGYELPVILLISEYISPLTIEKV